MTPVKTSTIADFYENKAEGRGTLLANVPNFSENWLIFDRSPFHPEDYGGGDQPGDRGHIDFENTTVQVSDTKTLAIDLEDSSYSWPEVKLDYRPRRDDPSFLFLTAHVVKHQARSTTVESLKIGDVGCLEVDRSFRNALSLSHTSVHVMALALNRVLSRFWRKTPPSFDALGHPHFDMLAVEQSKIVQDGGEDVYRIGKSLRKKGFNAVEFFESSAGELSDEITAVANSLVKENGDSKVWMSGPSLNLGSTRFWNTRIGEKTVKIPCGGTHAEVLGDVASMRIELETAKDSKGFVVTTRRC